MVVLTGWFMAKFTAIYEKLWFLCSIVLIENNTLYIKCKQTALQIKYYTQH